MEYNNKSKILTLATAVATSLIGTSAVVATPAVHAAEVEGPKVTWMVSL